MISETYICVNIRGNSFQFTVKNCANSMVSTIRAMTIAKIVYDLNHIFKVTTQ